MVRTVLPIEPNEKTGPAQSCRKMPAVKDTHFCCIAFAAPPLDIEGIQGCIQGPSIKQGVVHGLSWRRYARKLPTCSKEEVRKQSPSAGHSWCARREERKSSEERMAKQRLSSDALAALIAHLRSNACGIIRGPQQHCTCQRRATDSTALLLQFGRLKC